MKNVLRLLILAAAVASFTLPALAQDTTTGATATPQLSPQEQEAKTALYNKWRENYKGNAEQQKVAYEAGKEYISKYGSDNDVYINAIRKWVPKYEWAIAEFNFNKAVAENPSEAFRLSQDVLAKSPDTLKVYLQLVAAGLKAAGAKNIAVYPDAANAARKALGLIEQGKTTDSWAPYTSQQEAAAGLRYHIGFFTLASSPEEAATNLVKVAQSNTSFSKEPTTFQYLGLAYLNGEFKKLAAEYKEKYEGKDETPESKALFDKINLVLDRVIDAYARAVALSRNNPKSAPIEAAVKPDLTTFYKQRHDNSDAGLQELIASVLTKPLPTPGQEPVAQPASSSVTGTDGTTPTGQPVSNPATATPTPAANAPKPAATPTPTPAKPTTTTTPPANQTPKPKPPVAKAKPAAKSRARKTVSGR